MTAVRFWVFGFFLFFSFDSSVAEAASAPTRVVITLGSFNERETALFVAKIKGSLLSTI